jgi:uridine kinase
MVNIENKKIVIGISGYARSGKDTLANILKSSFIEKKNKHKDFFIRFCIKK